MPTNQNAPTTPKKSLDESQSKILKNLSARLTDDYFNKKNFPIRTAGRHGEREKDNLDEYIRLTAKKISGIDDEDEEDKPILPSPEEFNGVKGVDEERTLLKEQLKHLERENLKLKHEIDLLKADYDEEKKHTSQTIRDLKSELHRTAPLTDNKFFTFSKDLREVVDSVKALTQDELTDSTEELKTGEVLEEIVAPPTVSIDLPVSNKTIKPIETLPPKQIIKEDEPQTKSVEEPIVEQKSVKKSRVSVKTKKIIATSTVVAVITFAVGTFALNQKPEIDQKMVDAYLAGEGEVQGAQTSQIEAENTKVPTLVKKENKNNIVSFEETKWEVFRDEFLGFQIEYPGNVSDILHTGNTVTFLRKEGYLFKMQRHQTDKKLDEYWNSIKDNGLQYEVEKTKINIDEALHLTLKEEVEFPGNRYLLKKGNFMYDLWYAIPNPAFDDADMKRVDKMIESMRFL